MQCSPPYVQPRVEAINHKIYLTTTWGWPKYQHFSNLTVFFSFFFHYYSIVDTQHTIQVWYTRLFILLLWTVFMIYQILLSEVCFLQRQLNNFLLSCCHSPLFSFHGFFWKAFFQHGISEIQPTEQHPPALVQGRKASCHRKHFREFITLQDCKVL